MYFCNFVMTWCRSRFPQQKYYMYSVDTQTNKQTKNSMSFPWSLYRNVTSANHVHYISKLPKDDLNKTTLSPLSGKWLCYTLLLVAIIIQMNKKPILIFFPSLVPNIDNINNSVFPYLDKLIYLTYRKSVP
jgi:hypothetical protein